MMASFFLLKVLSLIGSCLLIVVLRVYIIGVLIIKLFPIPVCLNILPSSSSVWFSVSVLIMRSSRHLELSFVQGPKNESICILLYSVILFEKNHLLKMLCFSKCVFLDLEQKSNVHSCLDLYIDLQVDSINKQNMSVFVPETLCACYYSSVVQLDSRNI